MEQQKININELTLEFAVKAGRNPKAEKILPELYQFSDESSGNTATNTTKENTVVPNGPGLR